MAGSCARHQLMINPHYIITCFA